MRKIFIIIATLFLFTYSTEAQTTLGFNLGFNSSSLSFTVPVGSFNTDSRKGLYAGISAEYHVNEVFSVQPELNFGLYGAKTLGVLNRTTYNLSYVNLPILGVFISEPFSFYGGPQVSYLSSANGIIKKNGDDTKYDIKGDFKSVNTTALLGVGYTLENGLGIDVRFQIGFFNIANNKSPEIEFPGLGPDTKIDMNAVQLGIHYKFLKKKVQKGR